MECSGHGLDKGVHGKAGCHRVDKGEEGKVDGLGLDMWKLI